MNAASIVAVAVVAVAVVGLFGYVIFAPPSAQAPNPSSGTTAVNAVCSISGQPGPFFLRVMSASNLTGFVPVVGARVTATNQPAFCGAAPATKQATVVFTTNSTMWYPLDSNNNAGYSIVVSYQEQDYSLTVGLRPVSVTCATLFVPSGATNVTITEFQSACE